MNGFVNLFFFLLKKIPSHTASKKWGRWACARRSQLSPGGSNPLRVKVSHQPVNNYSEARDIFRFRMKG